MAVIPQALREAMEARGWPPLSNKEDVDALILVAKVAKPLATETDPAALELARRVAFPLADEVMATAHKQGQEAAGHHAVAMERAALSADARKAANADRDAAIRDAWDRCLADKPKGTRAEWVRKALRKKAAAVGWNLPGVRQIIRISEGE